ncbi:hypothetical protein IA525_03795 [Listeria seeligeri]|uniref:hypothetical protein n=1 Tax=Listeria seeligeri TaxID=1640 RepID=UPI00188980A9|nr:hypothetical protein [Listeria seeligeri]MBF2389854.1 hypothetical protein [Listeria seeligeri]
MLVANTLNNEMKKLGFHVFVSNAVYMRDVGKNTVLVVEAEMPDRKNIPSHGVYVYTFYKAQYLNEKLIRYKVYAERVSIRYCLMKVKKQVAFLKTHEIIQ